ncbi:MAG TPA: response regulator [Azospirillum sp.]|nr:response regulator [Azospirillum sp.]
MLSTLSPHVLIAEDDSFAAMALKEFLCWSGCRVTVAHDGLQALAAYRKEAADIVVTDVMMPRLDGNGLIRELWAVNPDLPVVAITGDVTRLNPEHLQCATSHRFASLTKPVKPGQLIESIRFLLTNKQELQSA